jgi:2-dehydropantoate 2-reductase
MKILVMGAGAVGAFYGARLQQAGEEVVLCARGENLAAMRERGLEVKSYKGDLKLAVKATARPADFAPYDLVLFAVKSYDTEASAQQLVGCLAPDGIIMTIQNGVARGGHGREFAGRCGTRRARRRSAHRPRHHRIR